MCLSTITKRIEPSSPEYKEERWGWKIFWESPYNPDRLFFKFYAHRNDNHRLVLRGRWLKAKVASIYANGNFWQHYDTGFHVYKKRPSGDSSTGYTTGITRVRVKGVHTIGMQDGAVVMVANRMFVPLPKARKKKRGHHVRRA